MSSGVPPFETILKLCQQAGDEPWYPQQFAASLGIDPRKLAGPLDDLRLAGLIEEVEWQSGREHGYLLTRAGEKVLQTPRLMARLRAGELPHFDREDEPPEVESARDSAIERSTAVMKRLVAHERPYGAYAVLAANVVVCLAGMHIGLGGNWGQANLQRLLLGGNWAALRQTGAVDAGDVMNGDWWRLFTSTFVHRDLFHLLINMSTFMAFARRAEQFWGHVRFLAIFLIAGFGSVCITLWHDPTHRPLGASGGLCGVMLSLAVWFILNKRHLPRDVFTSGLRQVGYGFLWWMLWMGLIGIVGGLRFWWVGHIAGAAIGVAAAVLLHFQQFLNHPARWMFVLPVAAVPLACFGLLMRAKDSDPAWRATAQDIKKETQQRDEIKFFNGELSPIIHKARPFTKDHAKELAELCRRPVNERKEIELVKARATVREAREATDAALAAIVAAGPIKTEKVANAVAAAQKFLDEQTKLLDLLERHLNSKENLTENEEEALAEQVKKSRFALNDYDKK